MENIVATKSHLFNLRKWATNDKLVQNAVDDKQNKSEGMPSSNIRHDDDKIHSVVVQNMVKYLALIGAPIQFALFSNSQTLLKQQTDCKLPNIVFSRCLQCFSIHWVFCVR